jgi:ferric-dicitrate binding protein FerR (iron transport regulator)
MEEPLPSFNEIITDESFIRWVKHNSWQDASYWEEKIKQNPDIIKDITAAKQLLSHLSTTEKPVESSFIDDIWNKIERATPDKKSFGAFRYIYLYAASAAAVLLILIIGLIPQVKTFTSENGEIVSLTLPDHSKVTLNAASSVVYKGNRFNTQRTVQLKGEAYFQVSKGKPFKVVTAQGIVSVLGTSFNVRSRDKTLTVVCYSGKVKVSDHFKSVYLTKGKKTAKLPGEIIQDAAPASNDDDANWRNGSFYFKNALLKEVLAECSRQYDVAIEWPVSEENRLITVSFNNKNITSALFNILWPLNLKAEKKDGKYRVQKSNAE